MRAVKARFDGKRILLPEDLRNLPPGEVIVVFTSLVPADDDRREWSAAQEAAFTRVWDNPEDAVYDAL
ncbi:MAG: toxin-antitoxin system, antitoxin component, Xre family protein [Deltaproteobacteria bacterium]|nr:toxin-antitoxin system, antitoxin component, Xre family protein [Deltaproteobacteria bacterium]